MFNENYFFSNKKQERKNKKLNNKANRTKRNKKGFIIGVVAGVLALITAATGIVIHLSRKKNPTNPTNTNSISISDIGTELEIPNQPTSDYGDTTGNINKDELVEKDGKIYVDKESADKSDEIGNTSTDTKGDTLEVDPNGKVHEKEDGYEIKDENGNIVESGDKKEDGSIENFEKNEELGGTYEEEDNTSNLVRADADYYNEEGVCIIKKGSLLSKEALEYAKENLSTSPISSYSSTIEESPKVLVLK